MRRRRAGAAVALALGLLVTSGCSAPAEEGAEALSPVVRPGAPGEEMTTLAPEDWADPGRQFNEADVTFVVAMIHHHLQALDMADLAATRAADPGVAGLAERIAASQGPEVHALVAWLQAREIEPPRAATDLGGTGPRAPSGHDGDEHGAAMTGMLTDEQMAALAAADGPEFDRLFLEGMIVHHEGAVAMAATVLVDGVDLDADELATDVSAGQSAEIGRMQEMLDGL